MAKIEEGKGSGIRNFAAKFIKLARNTAKKHPVGSPERDFITSQSLPTMSDNVKRAATDFESITKGRPARDPKVDATGDAIKDYRSAGKAYDKAVKNIKNIGRHESLASKNLKMIFEEAEMNERRHTNTYFHSTEREIDKHAKKVMHKGLYDPKIGYTEKGFHKASSEMKRRENNPDNPSDFKIAVNQNKAYSDRLNKRQFVKAKTDNKVN